MSPRDPLVLHRQLARLAALEAQVRTALRVLHATYQAAIRPQRDDELFEITTARTLAELCDDLLVALDDHRSQVAPRLKTLQHPDQTACVAAQDPDDPGVLVLSSFAGAARELDSALQLAILNTIAPRDYDAATAR